MIPKTVSNVSSEIVTAEMTNKTYKIDFNNNRIVKKVDGIEALKQAIYFIMNTVRYKHIIYSKNHGNELLNAIGLDYDLARAEVERYVKEAILADDRFREIQNYTTSKLSSDSVLVKFDVLTNLGSTINVEQEVGV